MPEERDTTKKQYFQNSGNVEELEIPVPKRQRGGKRHISGILG